jgi:hypothetical protein
MRSPPIRSSSELWELPFAQPQIDPIRLASAIVQQVRDDDLDFRTRLLIRDSMRALKKYWGDSRFAEWMHETGIAGRLEGILNEDLGEPGFTALERRLMDATRRESINGFLRSLGDAIPQAQDIYVGGSSALIVVGLLDRRTDDIDVVDEVPALIRNDHELLRRLADRYNLRLTHFQSHFLPDGWRARVRAAPGDTGKLHVFLVDPIDIAVSKLFSNRERDQDDLRYLASRLERDAVLQRVRASGQRLLAERKFKEAAGQNWYIVYGDRIAFE